MSDAIITQTANERKYRMDLTGQRYGRLLILGEAKRTQTPNGIWHRRWTCQCDCSKIVAVDMGAIRAGNILSCGCLNRELVSKRRAKHRMCGTRTYHSWQLMTARCNNPNTPKWHRYGGRGIYICERWKVFVNFLKDMGEIPFDKTSIGRINNDGPYCKDNCRWETAKEQANNTKTNRMLTLNGVSKNTTQWSSELGINRRTLTSRLDDGHWSIEDALTIPANHKKPSKVRVGQ